MRPFKCLAVFCLIILGGCSHLQNVSPNQPPLAYRGTGMENSLLSIHCPVFLVHGQERAYNRIARPVATDSAQAKEQILMDPDNPAIYAMEKRFSTDRGTYTNLIYRIHFSQIPFSLVPFHISAGKNMGLLVVVTLDQGKRPVLITTVHTCGCYKSLTATDFLDKAALPQNFRPGDNSVYGEAIPGLLPFSSMAAPRLVVEVRPGVHRVMGLSLADSFPPDNGDLVLAEILPMENLERLAIKGGFTSLYYEEDPMRGFVKGAQKPFETLLLGIPAWDMYVGTDKNYGPTAGTCNLFYTSLKPWDRKKSNMWDFARFLDYWGWKL